MTSQEIHERMVAEGDAWFLEDEPVVTTNGRTKQAAWVVAQKSETTQILAVLSVHHSVERKQFWASLQQETEDRQGGWTSRSFWAFQNLLIGKEPVARYSAKARDEFFQKATAEVIARGQAGDTEVQSYFQQREEAA